MKGIIGVIVALVVIAGIVAVVGIVVRNRLISSDEAVKESWSQVDTQLQRRADLVPNLVNTVKGYAAHESAIFTEVAQARSRLLAAGTPVEKAEATGELNGVLGRLLAIAENYPNLKADQSFVRLQDELAGTENRIAVARTRYNNSVRAFNSAIRTFPGSLFVGRLGFVPAEYYNPPAGQALQTPPTVTFE